MRLSELLSREVVTESGLSLGRVHDVRGVLEDGRLRVTGLAAAARPSSSASASGPRAAAGPAWRRCTATR